MPLSGKAAIVTGAATGIGSAIAQRLAHDGASVMLADIADAQGTAASIASGGGRALARRADVTDAEDMRALAAAALAEFGRIDILVNNAAISGSLRETPTEQLALSDWNKVLEVNATGVFLACRAVIPTMKAQRSGRIINLASGAAFKGTPFILHYVASKGAVISITRALARELGEAEITVNAVAPGYTLTETQLANDAFREVQRAAAIAGRALKRDAYASDIVGAVAFLAGDDARFITGQILAVDGGSVYH